MRSRASNRRRILTSHATHVLLWQLRVAFHLLVCLAMSVGGPMVTLAAAFRACGRAGSEYGPVVIPAQVVLLFVWAPVRLLFLALESSARFAYRTHDGLHRRRAAVA